MMAGLPVFHRVLNLHYFTDCCLAHVDEVELYIDVNWVMDLWSKYGQWGWGGWRGIKVVKGKPTKSIVIILNGRNNYCTGNAANDCQLLLVYGSAIQTLLLSLSLIYSWCRISYLMTTKRNMGRTYRHGPWQGKYVLKLQTFAKDTIFWCCCSSSSYRLLLADKRQPVNTSQDVFRGNE